ncbi:MAG: hypothetical protein D6798_11305 [Deltaproteobacteria bacterium]|nr:MAG: hypothetical protein D6798_11305 [Deltaproteobacteria bacterium]
MLPVVLSSLLLSSLLLPAVAAPPADLVTPTPVDNPDALSGWFLALQRAEAGEGVARALHYGDSTLAADGLASTVRDRLQARFGDAGPGFVPASFLPQWSVRSDVVGWRQGDWSYKTILYGGGGGRYGLGGIVGIMRSGASVTVRAVDGSGEIRPMQHLEAWYQAGVGYGTLSVSLDGATVDSQAAVATATEDRVLVHDGPFDKARLRASGGAVPLYGVVLESGRPGATWETLSVSGVGSKSFSVYAGEGLALQVARRDPDLIVVMLGGNEAGYPVLSVGDGSGYTPIFQAALDTIRAGAPDAACLVLSPLDQGEVDEDGHARSKRGMPNLVARQRDVALDGGCAFWNTWQAMGGEGAAVTWGRTRGIGTGDFVHVTGRGLALLGDALADALLQAYDAWGGVEVGGPGTVDGSGAATN